MQFYPGDWRKDPGIQALTYEERGIWFELLLMMHESEEYGYLTLNGYPIENQRLAQMLNLPRAKVDEVMQTFLDLGVAKREKRSLKTKDLTGHNSGDNHGDNVIPFYFVYCKRLVEDCKLREGKSVVGKQGGNPNFKRGQPNPYYSKQKDLDNDNQTDNQLYNHEHNQLHNQEDKQLYNLKDNQKITSSSSTSIYPKTLASLDKKVSGEGDDPDSETGTEPENFFNGNGHKRATRISRDYKPDRETLDFLELECPLLKLEVELPEFIDHWVAVGGKAGLKVDWHATFRNNLRKHQRWAEDRKLSPMNAAQELAKRYAEEPDDNGSLLDDLGDDEKL